MRTFETPGPVAIEVHNKSGEVRVELSETTETTVEFSAASDAPLPWLQEIWGTFGGPGRTPFDAPDMDRTIAEFTPAKEDDRGGRLYVDTRPAAFGWHNRIDVHITAPRNSEIRVHGQATNVRILGSVGALAVRTASGDVTAETCVADVHAATASGDVVLGPVAGDTAIRTVAGDVRIRSVTGSATVQSTSGNVLLGPVGHDAVVRTVSGDVTVAQVHRGAARLATVSGDVDIALRRGTAASVGLSSMSGQIRSDLVVEAGRSPAREGEAERAGSQRVDLDLRVKSLSGNIRLRRAADAASDVGEDAADLP